MPRVKQIALSDPPSQEPLEGGSDSALPFTSNTVASTLPLHADPSIQSRRDFSTALYVANVVEESEDMARQAGAALGKVPRLAAKVAAPSRRSSPHGCKGRKSRIARLGKQRDEVR